jgi:D-alanyl-D-alanine carboxypeptidase (penicillin-binding protein 5/6)
MIVYTSTWMDELRGGETELVNTNRLVRHYQGANGLKTGTTDDAGCCISASAERDGLTLIAVILNAPNSDTRFASARGLLDYGFANYTALPTPPPQPALGTVAVRKGLAREVALKAQAPKIILVEKGAVKRLEQKQELVESLEAPVAPIPSWGRYPFCSTARSSANIPSWRPTRSGASISCRRWALSAAS